MMVGKTSARSRVSKGGGVGVTAHEPLAVEIERRFRVKLAFRQISYQDGRRKLGAI